MNQHHECLREMVPSPCAEMEVDAARCPWEVNTGAQLRDGGD